MDKLRAMRVFSAVVHAGSLSAAARELGEPLTNVSRLVAQLEADLGVTLIARTTRRMVLTSAGRDFLETCRRVFDELDGAGTRIAGREADLSGEIAITAPSVFGRLHVLPLITEFLGAYPRMSARMLLLDRVVDLLEEGIDVAVRIGDLADSSLVATRAGSMRLVTCAAPTYLRKHGEPKTPGDLDAHDCVTFSNLAGGTRWVFKSANKSRSTVRVRSRLAVNTAEAAVDAAIAGIGITRLMSYQVEAALARGRLTSILEEFESSELPIHLVHRTGRSGNPRVRAFIELAAAKLRKRFP